MAIISGKFCENDDQHGDEQVPAEYELDSWGVDSGGGGFLCDGCATRMAEDAYERKLEGGGSVSIAELSDRAYQERNELRKRD